MENKKKELIDWALAEFKNDIKIYEQRWNFFSSQPYFDYRVMLSIGGIEVEGRGVSSSQRGAINSSIAEAIERYAIKFTDARHSSSGCAIHSEREIARINSQRELIERHYVMLFTLGYSNHKVAERNLFSPKVKKIVEELELKNIEVDFYILSSSGCDIVTLCQISGLNAVKKFGVIFGASNKENLEASLEASFQEALPNLMAFLNGNINSVDINNFKIINRPYPEDHLRLYLDVEFAFNYLSNRKLNKYKWENFDSNLFEETSIDYPYASIYPVIKSSHPSCIEALWGFLPDNFSPKNLNPIFPFVLP